MNNLELEAIFKLSSFHREQILNSYKCGCFYCLEIFEYSKITKWADKNQTAICPLCNVDSILAFTTQADIDIDLLKRLKSYYFSWLK